MPSAPRVPILDKSGFQSLETRDPHAGLVLNAEHKIYEEERKQSNELPHRQHDLEVAIANLQFGPFAPRVHVIIDKYLAELPASDKRNEDDLIWQLALSSDGLRQYIAAEAQQALSSVAFIENYLINDDLTNKSDEYRPHRIMIN